MSASWLKMIGTSSESPWEVYEKNYADFARRPRHIHPGDGMILYAVGGSKRVFAAAQVTSEVYSSGRKRWPYRVDIKYVVNLPVASGVDIDKVSSPGRDLLRPIRRASYFRLHPEEYDRAAAKLREASKSRGR